MTESSGACGTNATTNLKSPVFVHDAMVYLDTEEMNQTFKAATMHFLYESESLVLFRFIKEFPWPQRFTYSTAARYKIYFPNIIEYYSLQAIMIFDNSHPVPELASKTQQKFHFPDLPYRVTTDCTVYNKQQSN
ncbi:unnamed protein product [Ambrosiozyma monospora]|uniref:Unnamed protein product n=1 Tax=Ambrosiozyma monospora TaxID=43982 RepID=A0ACB5SX23_AMBMO|nr:unnamed protein product [Ambrosiozyma monospora]